MVARRGDLGSVTQIFRQIQRVVEAKKNDIAVVALKDVEGRMKKRIFNAGKASDGSQIGQYSTKPMLVGRSSFPFSTAANKVLGTKKKRSKLPWVTVSTRKGNRALAVLEGGYKQYRKLNGRQNSKVDLELTSDLRNGIQVGSTSKGPALGFINDASAVKAEGNEKRFGKVIFAVTASEDRAIDRELDREVTRLIQKIVRRV